MGRSENLHMSHCRSIAPLAHEMRREGMIAVTQEQVFATLKAFTFPNGTDLVSRDLVSALSNRRRSPAGESPVLLAAIGLAGSVGNSWDRRPSDQENTNHQTVSPA